MYGFVKSHRQFSGGDACWCKSRHVWTTCTFSHVRAALL